MMTRLPRRRRRVLAVIGAVVLSGCTPSQSPPVPVPASSTVPSPPSPSAPGASDLAPGLLPRQPEFAQPTVSSAGPGSMIALDPLAATATGLWTFNNVGLSFEATELADPRWDPAKGYLDELLLGLGSPGLRFGGNSIDRRVFWTSTNEPAPEWAEVTLTPADFERLAATVRSTGSAVTLSVGLGHFDPERAADMAYHAHQSLGAHLVGVSIGNEPNGFNLASQPQYRIRDDGWSPEGFVAEAAVYVAAIHERIPDLPIVGPGAFDAKWWRAFIQAGFPDTAALTQHWYPMWSCDGIKEPRASPSVENLTSGWLHDRADFIIGMGHQTAAAAGLPLWMEETGPTSCAGTNSSSRTHAQALWTADYSLHAATLGVTRLNHHSMLGACSGGAPMSVLCDPDDGTDEVLQGQANYLALMLLGQLHEGDIHQVAVPSRKTVFAYTVSWPGGFDLVVVNFDDPQNVGRSPLVIAAGDHNVVAISQLNGTDLDARNKSTLIPLSPAVAEPVDLNPGSVTLLRYESPASGSAG